MSELLFIEKIPADEQQDFSDALLNIASALGLNPNWLMGVFDSESGVNPKAINNYSGATGLIQFMPTTAVEYGTTTQKLYQMSATEQLDYVYQYLKRYAGKIKSFPDLYMAVFYPAAIGRSESFEFPDSVRRANSNLDLDKNGILTKGEFDVWIYSRFPAYAVELLKKKELA